MRPTVAIIDYGINHLHSVFRMVESTGAKAIVTCSSADVTNADKIILPGIGHFGRAMENLVGAELIDVLTKQVTVRQKPVLGICLGMQLMMQTSEEAAGHYGLCWLPGGVTRLHATDARRYKVPHIGWNSIERATTDSRLLKGIEDGSEFYFTHSFTCMPAEDMLVAATTEYETPFVSVIEHNSMFGVQFHPEKSRTVGATLLKNFVFL